MKRRRILSVPIAGLLILALPAGAHAYLDSAPHATTTQVTCRAPFQAGLGSRCTAVVTDTGAPPTSFPTGSVEFTTTDGGGFAPSSRCSLGHAAGGDSSGCSLSYRPAAAGSQTVTATYAGDATHAGSSGAETLNVSAPRRPFLKLGRPKLNTRMGTATVVATIHVAGRLVVFGKRVQTEKRRDVQGKVKLPIVPTARTKHRLRHKGRAKVKITVRLDPEHHSPFREASKSERVTLKRVDSRRAAAADAIGSPRASATSLTCGTKVSEFRGTQCTARVVDDSPPGSVPTGIVSFSATDEGALGSCQLAADDATQSSCRVIYSPMATGIQTVTATYSGDPLHSGSSGTATVNVVPLRPPFLRLAKPKLDKSNGTASIVATIHIAGRLSLFGPDVVLQKRKLVGPGDVTLPIVPDAKIAGRLKRRGHARVKVTVRFVPHGNTPFEEGSKSEHVTLKRR